MNTLRTVYNWLAALIFVGVLVQFAFAGYGAFFAASQLKDKGDVLAHKPYDHAWSFHSGFGTILVIAMIVLLLIGLAARLGRPLIWWPLGLAVAGVVQILLAELGRDHAKAGFLHPLNALLLFGLSGYIAHSSWRTRTTA